MNTTTIEFIEELAANYDIQIFFAILLLALLLFYWKRPVERKTCNYFLTSFALSLAITLLLHYIKGQWLTPVMEAAKDSQNALSIILMAIGALLAVQVSLVLFEINRISSYYQSRTRQIKNDIHKENDEKIKSVIEENLRQVKNEINSHRIYTLLSQTLLNAYLRATTLDDNEAAIRTRIIPDILPIFSIYPKGEQARNRAELNEAIHVLKHSDIPVLDSIDGAYEYIETVIAPQFECDPELYPVILEVIKKRLL